MITPEQSAQLKDYFPVKAHEFLNGATYLSEEAITNRLDEVDPSWEFHRLGEFGYRDNFVIATFRMTVCGVSRDGIGMWDLKMKKKDGNIIDATDPEKSVSTDALKRAARLFGIGRYILEIGKSVNDFRSLEQWLAARRRIDTSTGEMSQSNTIPLNSHQEAVSGDLAKAAGEYTPAPQNGAAVAKSRFAGNGAPPAGEKKTIAKKEPAPLPGYKSNIGKVYTEVRKLYKADAHMKNSIAALETAGKLTDDMTVDLAIRAIINHKDELEAPF